MISRARVSILNVGTLGFLLLGFGACNFNYGVTEKKPEPAAKPDVEKTDYNQFVVGQSYQAGTSTLAFASNRNFEFLYDSRVRYRRPVAAGARAEFVDARCVIEMTGDWVFFEAGDVFDKSIPAAAVARLSVGTVEVLSSQIMGEGSVMANNVCTSYARAIRDLGNFKLAVFGASEKYLGFVNFAFNILNDNGSQFLFENILEAGDELSYAVTREGHAYKVFARGGVKVDATSLVLNDLVGRFELNSDSLRDLVLDVSAHKKTMLVTSKICGFVYRLNVLEAYFDSSDSLLISLQSTPIIRPDNTVPLRCARDEVALSKMAKGNVWLRYRTAAPNSGANPAARLNITVADEAIVNGQISYEFKSLQR